ncbi:MAG: PstS family phosphate ABC transporter substrate-binding protein [Candidatus Omnitrophica bacterium]|nr:PstS family phosphate ABC transporter substrate-binding protein [Candidatus Omnitrophota bacterium]MBI5024475.1 PstS family phosphate ABC transporter substrate-binding protein [Candidatus Omnitrophota bacterium]
MKKLLGLIFLTVISVVICQKPALAADPVKVDGSSTVFPITEAVAEEFGKSGGGKVIVGISGTGGGFKRFCRGETDISDASRPVKQKEIDACRDGGVQYIEVKIAFDGLAVVVNPQNTWVDYLTVEELRKMWEPAAQGVIMKWNQIRSDFPAEDIQLFGPGTDSGTFDYFTEVINGKAANSRGDYTASEDDNVLVEGVASSKGGLGYFGLAYYEENSGRLKVVPVKGKGDAVAPSKDTVLNGSYAPLSRPLFIYVNKDSLKTKPLVAKFVRYYLENAPTLSAEVGYVPLPQNEYEAGLSKIQ